MHDHGSNHKTPDRRPNKPQRRQSSNRNTTKHHRPSDHPSQASEAEEQPAVTGEDEEKRDAMGSQPEFSLANNEFFPAQNVHVDQEYRTLNPQYGKHDDKPVWSLAQPLPRVVRPGMKIKGEDGKEQGIATETEHRPGEEEEVDVEKKAADKVAQPGRDNFFNSWGKVRNYFRESFAECLGTTVAITIGLSSTLSRVTSQEQSGTFETQCWSWGFGFMLGIYIAGGISGAQLNPAISMTLSFFRGFPARRCVEYIIAQVVGAILAGGITFGLYHDAIFYTASNSGLSPEQVFSQALYTTPKPYVHPATSFFNEFVGTAVLLCTIMAMGDHTNAPPGAGMQAFIIGLLITALCMCLGYNDGGCFNPARDFGPRFVVLMGGYGGHLFREQHAWWIWGPWVATIAGALFGAFVYDTLIFTGGESPVNYPPQRRKRALLIRRLNFRNKFPFKENSFKKRKRNVDIESAVRDVENTR